MKTMLTSLRSVALSRLMQYRKYRNFLLQQDINIRAANAPSARGIDHAARPFDPAAREIRLMRGWVQAIDRVREKLSAENPEKAQFMNRCFGLDQTRPTHRSQRACLIDLMIEMRISESTAYKWRENILDLVLFSAIEAGILMPFGKSGRKQDQTTAE